jgi:hypothetical protein
MDAHAIESLAYIRSTMARASAFTAVPGWGGVLMGITALGAAAIASRQRTESGWLAAWLAEAALATAIALAAMHRKSRRIDEPLLARPARQFAMGFAPPVVVAVILTPLLASHGLMERLPSLWLLSYGAAVVTAGAFSVPAVPLMGVSFMTLGAIAAVTPPQLGNDFMALGFGGLQIVFGILIGRRHGG